MLCNLVAPCAFVCVSIVILRLSDFPTFRLVLCLSLLPLNSGRFLQLTLIDICCCCCYCCCLHLPAIFHLDFISHFGWSASSFTIEIDQCAVPFSASTQFAPVSYPSNPPARAATISRQLQFSLAKCFKLPLESRNLALLSACQRFPSHC